MSPAMRARLRPWLLGLAGVNAVTFLAFTLPRDITERQLQTRVDALREEIARLEAAVQAQRTRRQTLDSNAGDQRRFFSEVVGQRDERLLPTLLEIGALARELGLALDSQEYAPAEVKGLPLTRFTITLRVTGSYQQLSSFLDRLERSPRFLWVEEVRLAQQRRSPATLDVVVTVYFQEEPLPRRREGRG